MSKVILFDVWADYAHFRKYYTTTSPLSFSFPPRTTISGLIAAIIGLDKQEYIPFFDKSQSQIAIQIMNPIKKTRIAMNLINTKESMNIIRSRTQIRFEMLKNVKYRIYFFHSNSQLYDKLLSFLKEHKSVYTPCLGLSENIANFKFVNEVECEEKSSADHISVVSVVPSSGKQDLLLDFNKEDEYFQETIPIVMDKDRVVTEYSMVTFERNGRPMKVKVNKFWELDTNEKILFL